MKASELIKKLQDGISVHGDLEVYGGRWTWRINTVNLEYPTKEVVEAEFEDMEEEVIELPMRFYLS